MRNSNQRTTWIAGFLFGSAITLVTLVVTYRTIQVLNTSGSSSVYNQEGFSYQYKEDLEINLPLSQVDSNKGDVSEEVKVKIDISISPEAIQVEEFENNLYSITLNGDSVQSGVSYPVLTTESLREDYSLSLRQATYLSLVFEDKLKSQVTEEVQRLIKKSLWLETINVQTRILSSNPNAEIRIIMED